MGGYSYWLDKSLHKSVYIINYVCIHFSCTTTLKNRPGQLWIYFDHTSNRDVTSLLYLYYYLLHVYKEISNINFKQSHFKQFEVAQKKNIHFI